MATQTAGYHAFISYSHSVDSMRSSCLQSALQNFGRAFYQPRATRIFRDSTDLNADPKLWESITDAMSEAEYLLLLACPEASKSLWVRREIWQWLHIHNGAVDRLVIILTGGEVFWSDQAADFDWERTSALPKIVDAAEPNFAASTLSGKYEGEPRVSTCDGPILSKIFR